MKPLSSLRFVNMLINFEIELVFFPDAVQLRSSGREELGASFHIDGRLVYRHSGVPAHAINMFIRFKPLIANAIIIERHPPKSCHSPRCKNSIVLELVKQRLELKVNLDKQKLKIVAKNKIKVSISRLEFNLFTNEQ